MQGMTTTAGKLLFFIHSLHANKKITTKEQGTLKDLVVSSSPSILEAYARYEREGTELTLASNLFQLLRAEKANDIAESGSEVSLKGRRAKMAVSIPKRNIQKLPNIDNRI